MSKQTRKIVGTVTLVLSIAFFCLGVYFPLLSTKTKILGINWSYQAMNLFDTIRMFFQNKEYFLASVILTFTFILPIVEYVNLIFRKLFHKRGKFLQHLDKWNMLDVFLVALLLLNFKMNSNFIVMELKVGTTFIALAVIFRILTIILIPKNNSDHSPN